LNEHSELTHAAGQFPGIFSCRSAGLKG